MTASPVGVKGEDGTQNGGGQIFREFRFNRSQRCKQKISNLGEMTQLEGKGIAKSPEENGMQGVGNAARLAQASLKRDGERNPKPIGEY